MTLRMSQTVATFDGLKNIGDRKNLYPFSYIVNRHAAHLRNEGLTGKGVKVAVLDSGFNFALPMLDDELIWGEGPDGYGHGSMMGEIIGGRRYSHPYSVFEGVAPECEMISIKILNENGMGDTYWMARGINQAVDMGVDIINISAGSPMCGFQCPTHAAVKRALEKGIVIVAAAGNDGMVGTMTCPAIHPEVICVGSEDITTPAYPNSTSYSISSFSSSDETGWEGDVVAPGGQLAPKGSGMKDQIIVLPLSSNTKLSRVHKLGEGLAGTVGTSPAAAFYSGTVALFTQRDGTPMNIYKKVKGWR